MKSWGKIDERAVFALRENALIRWKSTSGNILTASGALSGRWRWLIWRANTFTLGNAERSRLEAWNWSSATLKLKSSLDTFGNEWCKSNSESYVRDVKPKLDEIWGILTSLSIEPNELFPCRIIIVCKLWKAKLDKGKIFHPCKACENHSIREGCFPEVL